MYSAFPGRGRVPGSRGTSFSGARGRRIYDGRSVTEKEIEEEAARAEAEAVRVAAEEAARVNREAFIARTAEAKPFVPEAVQLEQQRNQYVMDEKEKVDSLEREARRRYKEEEALINSLENYDMSDYDGGKRKKKKYTQKRQKKQRRRRSRRHSTRKYKK